MKWNKYTLKTRTEAEDLISSMMQDAGIEGIEIEDKVPLSQRDKEQMFVDILPEGLAATKNTESHTLTFTHEAEEDGTDMHASDKLYALVVETARWNSKLFELNTRADGEPAEVSLPAKWDMDALEVYVFALTEDGNTASDSMYLTVEEGS